MSTVTTEPIPKNMTTVDGFKVRYLWTENGIYWPVPSARATATIEEYTRRIVLRDYDRYLTVSPDWKARVKETRERDHYECQACESKDHLNTHHITYLRACHEDPEDLITLCRTCHVDWNNSKEDQFFVWLRKRRKTHWQRRNGPAAIAA